MSAINVITALLPDLMIIMLGVALAKWFDETLWAGLDKLAYYVLFPALIFTAAATSPVTLREVSTLGALVWTLLGAAFVLAWPLLNMAQLKFLDFAGVWQTAWRFNSGLAFVLAQALPGPAVSIMAVIVGLAVPVANVLAVLVLSHESRQSLISKLYRVLRNPFFIASASGIVVSILDLPLPALPMKAMTRVGSIAPVVILLVIGAALDWRSLAKINGLSLGLHIVKLLALPLIATMLVTMVEIDRAAAIVLVLFAALPTATAAPTLAGQFGADRKRVAVITVQSTVISLVTLPIWLVYLS